MSDKGNQSAFNDRVFWSNSVYLLTSGTFSENESLFKSPETSDDFATTFEETPVIIHILDNDESREGDEDDEDDDDDENEIDPGSVDLNPDTPQRDQSINLASGLFSVNDDGVLSYTPAPNFFGETTTTYTVDNYDNERSDPASVFVTVNNVNDPPVITGQNPNPIVTTENQPVSIGFGNLVVTDPDNAYPEGFSITITPGDSYSVSGSSITPNEGVTGVLSVPVVVNDGTSNSNTFNLQISVTAHNDPPVISGQTPNPFTTVEDQSFQIGFSNLIVTDPDDSYPTGFTLSISAGANYTVTGNMVTPSPNFFGSLSIPVVVNDGEANSDAYSFQVEVAAQNDAPLISGQTPDPLSVAEEEPLTIDFSHLIVADPDNSYPQGFSMVVSAGDNYTVSATTITPHADFVGSLSVPVTVNDGTTSSNTFPMNVVVTGGNDAPVITGQVALSTQEATPVTISLSHLIVADADNAYPDDFTLTIMGGANYSVSGHVVTPSSGFSGELSVGVVVNDGTANSNVFNLVITVNPVNDAPVITGQNPLSVPEDNALAIQLTDLIVTDSDNTYPSGFTITALTGANYTFSGSTITPALNFTGALTVNVVVNDGISNSNTFPLNVTVTAVNDAPQITGQYGLSINENQSLTILPAHLVVVDPDNSYPTGFTLVVFSGSDYTVSGTTITPAVGFVGTLTVPVQVSDGSLTSNLFSMSIYVNAINDPPVITGQVSLSTPEETPVTIMLAHLTVFDPDNAYPTGFSLAVHPGTNYSVSGTAITPAVDFNGTLNVSVTVNDGVNNSAPFNFQIQVGDANDPPTITGQVPLVTNEEQPLTLLLSHLSVIDPDNSFPTGFTILVSPGENFTVSGNVITPVPDFAGGLTVPVRVNDGVNNSATFNLQVQVNQVNDAPWFDPISNQAISENSRPVTITITNISKGPGEDDQQITFVARSGNTAVMPDPVITYNGTGPTATLQYAPVANASGVIGITVTAIDNGAASPPHQNSYSFSFQVEITEVNNAPTLNAIANILLQEDAEKQNISLEGITAGAGESQPLSVTASSNLPELFEVFQVVYTSPQSSGILEMKPAANASGVATVSITVTDNGSATSPSVNQVTRSFTITIQEVNDAPVFVSQPVLVTAVNEKYQYAVEVQDDDSNSLPITLAAKPSWLTISPVGKGRAMLSGTPAANASGASSVIIRVKDGALTVDQQFTLVVNNRPKVSDFAVETIEDNQVSFSATQFNAVYNDKDNHQMASLQITQLPAQGALKIGDIGLSAGDTVVATSLSTLIYVPGTNYAGEDAFEWKAFDGYHFSAAPASVKVLISPVNDPPVVMLETDTLGYEVNGEAALLTTMFTVDDPDDDSLEHAEIALRVENFQPESDRLVFTNTPHIRGNYDLQSGRLALTGKAPLEEYVEAIRSIQYNYLNTVDPSLGMKHVAFVVSDGVLISEEKDRLMMLQYTFIELEIPSGFTPNGDQVNDTWIITRPGGLDQLEHAEIRIFNRKGLEVFRTVGFEQSWDGRYKGEFLPADSYFFSIDLRLKNKKAYRGVVTILR